MYVDSNHLEYKYLVSSSDNYIVLTNTRSVNGTWDNPSEIDTYIQYINPSIYGFESYSTYTSTRIFPEIEVTDNFYARADSLDIIKVQIMFLFTILFYFNALTRLFKKGGAFFGS